MLQGADEKCIYNYEFTNNCVNTDHAHVVQVILDCSVQNAPFYEKCGFFRKEVQMAQYF